ncbi:hypothetical protein PAPYR_12701 [Paratrimastix pyriformis]|uniref:Uncharacterized protein n=1 Tax=Paratrimastix pyriformis TaxID=342808 RepID=A0ABQ8U3N5_9EUKA|nr:hypothetical protein PAPYR_12701 [Paratrimastix pyriformis]
MSVSATTASLVSPVLPPPESWPGVLDLYYYGRSGKRRIEARDRAGQPVFTCPAAHFVDETSLAAVNHLTFFALHCSDSIDEYIQVQLQKDGKFRDRSTCYMATCYRLKDREQTLFHCVAAMDHLKGGCACTRIRLYCQSELVPARR